MPNVKEPKRSIANDYDIIPEMGPGWLEYIVGDRTALQCVIELIKNAFDWGSNKIWITTDDRSEIRFLDNGIGMNAERRKGFVSIKLAEMHRLPGASGRFCTGAKMMLRHSTSVVVVTAPDDEPNSVYRFSFKTSDFEEMLRTKRPIRPEVLPKTKKTWPHDSEFGTEITYAWEHPKEAPRGISFAKELSGRLPMDFLDSIIMDGAPLPPKKIEGKPFKLMVQDAALGGTVSIQLYRPAGRTTALERLRFSAGRVGEVPASTFFDALPPDLHSEIPHLYTVPEMAGVITLPFVAAHQEQDRERLKASFAEQRGPLLRIVKLLQDIESEVAEYLNLRVQKVSSTEEDKETIQRVRDLFNKAYKKEDDDLPPPPPPHDPDETGDPPVATPLDIWTERKEYEPGDEIKLTARLHPDLAKIYGVHSIKFDTSHARALKIRNTPTGIVMVASNDIGEASIRAQVPGSQSTVSTSFRIVPARVFGLRVSSIRVKVGSTITIRTMNDDKLKGKLHWSMTKDSVGTLTPTPSGRAAVYEATKIGSAIVSATDSKNPATEATCDIVVVEDEPNIWRIRGHLFRLQPLGAIGSVEYNRPFTMQRQERVHTIFENPNAPGWKEARENGGLEIMMVQAIAHEFVWFELQSLTNEPIDPSVLTVQEMHDLITATQNKAFEIFAEVTRERTI